MFTSSTAPLVPESLKEEYGCCRDITYRHGPNFSVGFRFLPADKRDAVFSAYAFCRYVDDLADEGIDRDGSLLDLWERELEETYRGHPSRPITRALANTVERYPIPIEAFRGLIEGCRWDFTYSRYETFEKLCGYCDLVAATISDISLAIFGTLDKEAIDLGRSLAYGLQLTNIIRDVGEDVDRGRIYLPLEDLERFSVSEDELLKKRNSAAFIDLMMFQIDRARGYFDKARPLPSHIEKDAQLAVRLMGGIYVAILDKIRKQPETVLEREIHLTLIEKLFFVTGVLLKG